MSDSSSGMSRAGAFRLEVFIIGLGVLALVLIFQPFSIRLFAVGSGLVVLAGLVNNLLPLAQPGVKVRSVITVGLVVAMTFCIAVLVAITVAHLYGVFFLPPPDSNTLAGKAQLATPPFYKQLFVWEIAAATVILAAIVTALNKATR